MKLLVVTQAVDDAHPELGFFTRWLAGFAERFDRVEVICLAEGKHALPRNVRVHSLGKEHEARSRLVYSFRFLRFALVLRREYDAVFVHMNQEYVLLAGPFWKLMGKKIYLWRNHGSGSALTRLASALCRAIFFTSSASYTARFPNAIRMPVGIDLARFAQGTDARRAPGSVLMVGRIAPAKGVRAVALALANLASRKTPLALTLAGGTAKEHEAYRDECVALASAAGVGLSLRGAVQHAELPRLYQEHDIVVNASEPGMFDKTMLEALASGCLLLTHHGDLGAELDPRCRTDGTPADIANKLASLALLPADERERLAREGKQVATTHGLDALMARLAEAMGAAPRPARASLVVRYLLHGRFPTEKAHGTQVEHLCRALAAEASVELIAPDVVRGSEAPKRSFAVSRIPVPRFLPRGTRAGFMLEKFGFLRRAMRRARTVPTDLVVTREPLALLFSHDFPIVLDLHDLPSRLSWYAPLMRRAALVVAKTKLMAAELRAVGIPENRILVLQNAIDPAEYEALPGREEARRSLHLGSGPAIAYAGSHQAWKGVGTLLKAAALMPDVSVLVIGGSEADLARSRKDAPSNAHFLPHAPRDAVLRSLCAADLFALPNERGTPLSERYTSPLKLFEYAAIGRPVLASALPSIKEAVRDDEAFFFAPGDAQSLADAARAALARPEEARARAERLKSRLSTNDWRSYARALLKVVR